jgi:hypothetical protein
MLQGEKGGSELATLFCSLGAADETARVGRVGVALGVLVRRSASKAWSAPLRVDEDGVEDWGGRGGQEGGGEAEAAAGSCC